MSSSGVEERVAVVTGAFGALGRALSERLEAGGYQRALLDRATGPVRSSPRLLVLDEIDLADATAAKIAIARIVDHFGRIDAVFNVAGAFRWETVADGAPETWEAMHRVNLLTALHVSRAALPALRAQQAGRIVNVGASSALRAGAGMAPYAASKAGVHALTQSLADELKATRITVNAVLPSIIDTPTNRRDMPDADCTTWVTADDVSSVMLFLASDASRAITGALVPVTGAQGAAAR